MTTTTTLRTARRMTERDEIDLAVSTLEMALDESIDEFMAALTYGYTPAQVKLIITGMLFARAMVIEPPIDFTYEAAKISRQNIDDAVDMAEFVTYHDSGWNGDDYTAAEQYEDR